MRFPFDSPKTAFIGLGWGALLTIATPSAAQDAFGIDSPPPAPPALEGTEQAVVAKYWQLGRPRPFLATTLEAGFAYLRPRFFGGWGQPYWRWIGVEMYPLLSLSGLGGYAGLAGAIPGLSFRVGGRYTYPFGRTLLAPAESYSREDIEIENGPRADYLALEAGVTGTVPIAVGTAFLTANVYNTQFVEDGYYLFEESFRAVMDPPWIWRARLGYLFSFGQGGTIRIGPAAEVIGLPGREEFIVRAGLLGSVLIGAHLEAQVSLIPAVVSPDTLGVVGGDFGQLGIRARWATDSQPDPQQVPQLKGQPRPGPRP